jgi:hypothetical protein
MKDIKEISSLLRLTYYLQFSQREDYFKDLSNFNLQNDYWTKNTEIFT